MSEYSDINAALAAVSNPQATAEQLAAVAAAQPSLWAQIAAHANAYPDLLGWLGSVGDDSVRRAISARTAGAAPAAPAAPEPAPASVAPEAAPVAPEPAPERAAVAPDATVTVPEMPAVVVPDVTPAHAAHEAAATAPDVAAVTAPLPDVAAPTAVLPDVAAAAPAFGAMPTAAPGAPAPYGAPSPAPAWPMAAPGPAQAGPAGYYAAGGPMPPQMGMPAPKKKKRGGLIALLVALAVLLGGGGGGGWYVYTNWNIKEMSVSFGSGGGESLTMKVGDSLTGTVTTVPAKPLKDGYTYVSSAPNTLSLTQDGATLTIKALKPGSATIIGTSTNKGVTTTTRVTILQPATAIEGLPESISVMEGSTQTVKATIVPADSTDTLKFTIADEKVATIDADGVVTGVAVGTTTLTATAGSVKVDVPITVKQKYVWEYGNAQESIPGTGYRTWPQVSNATVKGCTGFSLFFTVLSVTPSSLNSDLANKSWAVWTYGTGGWRRVATFQYGAIATIYTGDITFAARDISKVAVVPATPPRHSISWSQYFTVDDTQTK